MKNLSFVFHCEPQAKGRPRFGGGKVFTDAKTRKFENFIKASARASMLNENKKPLLGNLNAVVLFTFKQPKKTKLNTPRKDLDNLCKAIFDALNEVAYHDDTQVIIMAARKQWGRENKIELALEEVSP